MAKVWITLNGNHFIGGKVRRAGTAIEVDERLAVFFGKAPKKVESEKVKVESVPEPAAEIVETEPVETETETAAGEPIDEPKKKARKARKT